MLKQDRDLTTYETQRLLSTNKLNNNNPNQFAIQIEPSAINRHTAMSISFLAISTVTMEVDGFVIGIDFY